MASATANTTAASVTINAAPTATAVQPTLALRQGLLSTVPVTGSGGTGPLTYTISPPLPGSLLAMDPRTGAIEGAADVLSPPTVYTVRVADARGATATGQITLSVSAPQEIEVSASIGGAVTDGGTNPQGTSAAGSPVTVVYTVSNTGSADLTLGTATFSSASNVTVDMITAPASGTVAQNGTTTFSVTYMPTAVGAFSFDLSFINSDSSENPFNFSVSGTAAAPVPVLALTATPSATAQTVGRPFT